jgi:uncharacterized membrane protein
MRFIVQRDAKPIRVNDEQFYLILLSVMAAAVAAIVTSFALILHRNFLTIACDTAVIQSGIVNTMHGHWFCNNGAGGPNILASHTTFLLLLLIPLYIIFPSADTLFELQIWGIYSAVIPIYLVALELLRRPPLAFCIAAAALISPLLLHMAVAPVHLETWIVAAVFWSFYFYRRNNLVGFCASMLLAVCCGEQAAMIYIALGAGLLLINDGLAWRRRFGLVSFVAGLAWVILAVMVIAPFTRSAHRLNIFAYNYTQWHIKSFADLPMAVLQQPREALGFLTSPYRWEHVAAIIGLPLLATLLSWRSLLLLTPFPVYFLMCDQEFFLYFHAYYYSFAFFAGYLGLMFFLARREATTRAGISLMAVIMLGNVLLLCGSVSFYMNWMDCREDGFTSVLRKAFADIPPGATVYSPHRYSAYLSNRQNLVIGDLADEHFDFNLMLDAEFDLTNVHPEQVDYIVVDCMNDQCGCRQGGYSPDVARRRSDNINALLQTGDWRMIFNQSNTVILHRIGR